MLEGELDDHLGYDKHWQSANPNACNGHGKKTIKTGYGEMEIAVSRDRDASFNPIMVPKWESMVEGLEEVMVSMYANTISRITSRVTEDIIAWQNRPLESVYLIVWMDGIVFKGRKTTSDQQNRLYCRRTAHRRL